MQIIDHDDLFIPLPDGTRLAARLWRPEGAVVPAVLEMIPYRKRDNTLPRDEAMHPWMAVQGYACLRVDLRGTGDSEGDFDDEYSSQELADACAVIAWIAAQDWCSGAVGMMGKSWGGFNCLQTAALQPPALRAVVSVCATVDRFADDIHYKGGCLLGENFGWGSLMLSYCARPADPLLRPDWRQDLRRRIATMPDLSARWSGHQTRDDYWKHGSVCEDYSRLGVPILTIGGWNDNYMNAPAHLVRNAPLARAIVGPWVHQYPHTAVPGPTIDFLSEMKTWWDRWLKGLANGAEDVAPYRVWMLDSARPDASAPHRPGRWLAETLPSPRVAEQVITLPAAGRIIATRQTLGADAGEFFPMGLQAEMAGDQRHDDADSVCFDLSQPEGLALLGAARLDLTLSADRTFGQVVARLCDVAPDGASVRIAHGLLNLHHRCNPPAPLVPGQALTVTVILDQMAYRLAPGHRLRLALSNTYWPWIWPSPEPVRLTLHAAALTLPVHSGSAPTCPFAEAPPPAANRLRSLSPGREIRERRIDAISGRQQMIVTSDSGRQQNPDHGLQTRATMVETWSILPDDPLSASCTITWTQSFSRGDWSVETEVTATQTGTAKALILHADLRATLLEAGHAPEIIARQFDAQIPRQHA